MTKTNLLVKLKPEIRAEIEKDKDKFPYLYASIIKSLEENYWVIDLKYGTVLELEKHMVNLGIKSNSMFDAFNDN